jgi:hypothetical protein
VREFECKLMQASTAYRMTVYRHHLVRLYRTCGQLLVGKTESAGGDVCCKWLKITRLRVMRRRGFGEVLPKSRHQNRKRPQQGSAGFGKRLLDRRFRTYAS